MPDPNEDLRSTQDSIRRDADRLKGLEDQKGALDPGDPRLEELSEEVERTTAALHDKARAERELTEEIQEAE